MTDRVLVFEFGSQVAQLIARRVPESGVYLRDPFMHQGGRGVLRPF